MISMVQTFELLDKASKKSILVIGDAILDVYTYGISDGVSTGIKIPIIKQNDQVFNLGGAANVAANISAIVNDVHYVGQVADDEYGHVVAKLLRNNCIEFHKVSSPKTIVKQRIYVSGQQLMRLDTGEVSQTDLRAIKSVLDNICPITIVMVDYGYGMVTQSLIDFIADYKKNCTVNVVLSTRFLSNFDTKSIDYIVVNDQIFREDYIKTDDVHYYVTCGNKGILYYYKDIRLKSKAEDRIPINVSGAGDTALAVMGSLCDDNDSPQDIMELANIAAGNAVEYGLTYIMDKSELIDSLYNKLVNTDNQNKIFNKTDAKVLFLQWKKQGHKIVFTNGCYDLLHYGHFMLLEEAKKFGNKLIVGINSDESVRRLKGDNRPVNSLKERMLTLACLSVVDMIIPFDDNTASDLIKIIDPDVYVKGDEYKDKVLPEAAYAKRIEYIPMIDGISTTKQIEKIRKNNL